MTKYSKFFHFYNVNIQTIIQEGGGSGGMVRLRAKFQCLMLKNIKTALAYALVCTILFTFSVQRYGVLKWGQENENAAEMLNACCNYVVLFASQNTF